MAEPFLGSIILVGFNFAPRGYAFCNGQILAISQNAALFSLLGTTYGGNGTSTFALPNLQSRVPIHAGQVVNLDAGSGAGSVARCTKEGDCKLTESATITFDKYQERASATGHYELQFKGGEILKGTFEVKWCEERVICG
jgi:microcystin-dependent protein